MRLSLNNQVKKILFLLLPTILLVIFLLIFKPINYFVIDQISSVECDLPVLPGMKLEYLNNIEIKSLKDFENAMKSIEPNKTFFLIADGKIIRCFPHHNFSIEIKEIRKNYFVYGPNFERILIENNKKTRKYLSYLGFNNYIYDVNWLILPYDSSLVSLIEYAKNKTLSFYYEAELERKDDSAIFGGKEINISDLKEIFDEIEIKNETVKVRKILFSEKDLDDFSIEVIHLAFVSGYYVNLYFKVNETKMKELNNLLQLTPIRLINLEKFYNANFTVYVDSNKILDLPIPYTNCYNQINFTIFNMKNYHEIQKLISANLLESVKIV